MKAHAMTGRTVCVSASTDPPSQDPIFHTTVKTCKMKVRLQFEKYLRVYTRTFTLRGIFIIHMYKFTEKISVKIVIILDRKIGTIQDLY